MKPIQLVIPMSGQGTRYQAAGFREPKPLIPVGGTPMIQELLGVFPQHWPATFILAENHRETALPALLKQLRSNGRQLVIPQHKEGPGRALLEALPHLDAEAPALVSYCDFSMIWDAEGFAAFVERTGCDAALLSYRGFHPHYLRPTKYAYSRLEGDRVVDVKEKGNFTANREDEFASAGAYYFKSAALMGEALEFQRKNGLVLNGELYTSLTVKALLEMKPDADVRVFEIPYFFQWGTPEDLRDFEYWSRTFRSRARPKNPGQARVDQLVMPMAGLGSRFAALTNTPKPLIPVGGTPMFQRALASMPAPRATTIVTLKEIATRIGGDPRLTVLSLDRTPEGQAFTTRVAAEKLPGAGDVIVTACDHEIVLDPVLWEEFRKNPRCDAAIFTIKGFPGVARKPLAFSYVEVDANDTSRFPMVRRVSLKKNIAEDPLLDHLLVGTFWFRDATVLRRGIELLVERNQRMNGELYLDIVFDTLRETGAVSRVVPLDGYINWGDPDSFAEASYWSEVFGGPRPKVRSKFPGINA